MPYIVTASYKKSSTISKFLYKNAIFCSSLNKMFITNSIFINFGKCFPVFFKIKSKIFDFVLVNFNFYKMPLIPANFCKMWLIFFNILKCFLQILFL